MARTVASPAAVSPDLDLLTAQEAMAVLRCSRDFLRDHSADMGAVKIGRSWRVSRANLLAFVERGRIREPEPERETAPEPTRIRTYGHGPTNPIFGGPWS